MNEGAILFLAFIVAQRLSELALARRNTRDLLARGAREVGAAHYPLIVALHSAWIAALIVFGLDRQVVAFWLGVFVVLQAFRMWILASLGRRWTTRIIVLDAPLVARGPFRLMRHPNYLLVAAEIAVTPLALGLPWVALVFSALNAAALTIRIRAEERALAPLRASGAHGRARRGVG